MYKEMTTYEDNSFAVRLYETEGNVVQAHLDVKAPITKSVYASIQDEMDKLVFGLCAVGCPAFYTACPPDEEKIRLIEHLGFDYVMTIDSDSGPLELYEYDLTYGN
jgi:hypothetical protein